MTDFINSNFSLSYSADNASERSGNIMSSIMFRFLALFVGIIEKLKSFF